MGGESPGGIRNNDVLSLEASAGRWRRGVGGKARSEVYSLSEQACISCERHKGEVGKSRRDTNVQAHPGYSVLTFWLDRGAT